MKVKFFRLCFLVPPVVAILATYLPAAEVPDRAVQEEIETLKRMVLELQKRVRELEAQRERPGAAVSPPTVTAEPVRRKEIPVRPSRRKIGVEDKTPFEVRKPGVERAGAMAPGPLEIGGHQVRVGIAGALQVDVIHDFNAVGLEPGGDLERAFATSLIPVGGEASDITNRTGFSPNQSYLSGWAETDTPWGPLKVFADVNLMGSTKDTEFQIYKAYGQWGWLKAGLDYTLWFNQSTLPDTLDFEGPNAVPSVRFTQASLKVPLDPGAERQDLFLTVGVEDAKGDMTLPSGVESVDRFPSFIGKLSYEPEWAHVELGGLYRRLKGTGPGYDHWIDGWGVTFSGSIDTWKNDHFIWGLQYGDCLGAYIQDTAGLGLDAAPSSPTDSSLRAIAAFSVWGAYQHWWSKSLRSTATYGFVRLDSDFDEWPNPPGTGTYKQTQYASLNLVWSPWPPFDVGLEYMFGHRTVTDRTAVDGSTTGQDHRLQFTMRWSFEWER